MNEKFKYVLLEKLNYEIRKFSRSLRIRFNDEQIEWLKRQPNYSAVIRQLVDDAMEKEKAEAKYEKILYLKRLMDSEEKMLSATETEYNEFLDSHGARLNADETLVVIKKSYEQKMERIKASITDIREKIATLGKKEQNL